MYWLKGRPLQVAATVAGALSTFTSGQLIGWASPSIPILLNQNTTIIPNVTPTSAGWISSMMMVGNLIAIPLVTISIDSIGRKKTILLSALFVLLSWILIAITNSLELLYFARFLGGVGEDFGKSTTYIYVGEIAEPSIRGSLGSFLNVALNWGIIFEYLIGPFVSFRMLAIISAIIPILLLVSFVAMPESPYYLIMRNKPLKAKRSLWTLRSSYDVDDELESINHTIETRLSIKEMFFVLLEKKYNRYSLFLICWLSTALEICGLTPITMNAQWILHQCQMGMTETKLFPILLGVCQMFGSILATLTIDRIGKRKLYLASTGVCACALYLLSAYFFYMIPTQNSINYGDYYTWLPFTLLMLYNAAYPLGLICVPIVMMGELFRTNVKALAVPIALIWQTFSAIIAIQLFQVLSFSVGLWLTFLVSGCFCLLNFVLAVHFLPETTNRTLAEIQCLLKS